MSGLDLIRMRQVRYESAPLDTTEAEDIKTAVDGVGRVATGIAACALASLVLCLLTLIAPAMLSARLLFVVATLTTQGFVAFFFVGSQPYDADIHHLFGFVLAAAAGTVAAVIMTYVVFATREPGLSRHARATRAMTIVSILFVIVGVPIGLGAPDGDAREASFILIGLIGAWGVSLWLLAAWLTVVEPSFRSAGAMIVLGTLAAAAAGALAGYEL